MTITAIETRYKGCRFRSRLEARWAIVFDALGCRWAYEPAGFVLGGTPYLPDFWLTSLGVFGGAYPLGSPPERGFWIEVKPAPLSAEEVRLCALLSKESGHCVYAVAGNVGLGEFVPYKWHPLHPDEPFVGELNLDARGLNCFLHYLAAQASPRSCDALYDGSIPGANEALHGYVMHAFIRLYADQGRSIDDSRLIERTQSEMTALSLLRTAKTPAANETFLTAAMTALVTCYNCRLRIASKRLEYPKAAS